MATIKLLTIVLALAALHQSTLAFKIADCASGQPVGTLTSLSVDTCPDMSGDNCPFYRGRNVTLALEVMPSK
jgi:hypothetical protein